MVITNLEEKENRKIWVPIRGGNRGGWSLFEWEKVREMPYRDREMYLGNSAMIGVLDKGGKWRKKDWYLHRNKLESGEILNSEMSEAMRRDQERMNSYLGLTEEDEHKEKLSPAEMQLLLKRIRGNKEEFTEEVAGPIGLGFDKSKVEIRAKPTTKEDNPHRLEGNVDKYDETVGARVKQEHEHERSRSREQRKKKHKKQKHRNRSKSEERHRRKQKYRSESSDRHERRHKEKKHKH